MRVFKRGAWVVIAAVVLVLLFAASAYAAPDGAIFTTNADGSRVNQNIYPSKDAVYLDGGPGDQAPQWAAGLPDGWYVFQVTDPSGKTLLSTDLVKYRTFRVFEGIIVEAYNHPTGNDKDHPPAKTVKLMPYNNTPNPGGEYKVWAMLKDDFVAANGAGALNKKEGTAGKHGFVPSMTKTDNYKVKCKVPTYFCVGKFNDLDWDGVKDADEPYIKGWPIKVTDSLGCVTWKFTPACFYAVDGETYKVEEGTWSGKWAQTALFLDNKPLFVDPWWWQSATFTGGGHNVLFGNGLCPNYVCDETKCGYCDDCGPTCTHTCCNCWYRYH